ncbi:MAG: transketolase C-terminal domain-containing protein [Anaerolineae bacterium]|nr:transketolase C-terminal domain-containing protein [Anaerolineae bacterium]
MKTMTFAAAIEDALIQAMAADSRIVVFGEDVQMIRRNLYTRFGGERVRDTPISESAFLGAGVAAAMAGLRPVVEIIMVDFLGVAMDALLNHAAKTYSFSGGRWRVPLVVRTGCGGGYGDGGQHEQSLWGWLAHIPGLSVVVPATPADAGGLMLAALEAEEPVIFLEHKLLADYWLDSLGAGGRETVHYDVPAAGAEGPVPGAWQPLPLGKAVLRREGDDLTIVTLGVSVHRALDAATQLAHEGISATVIDLRSVAPLDDEAVVSAVARSGRLLVVDEDYEAFGLSGELAALVLEAGLRPAYARVCTRTTIPYARPLEEATLPNVSRIVSAARQLIPA